MNLRDKLKGSGDKPREFFHGVSVDEAVSILNDGYIFSHWFMYLKQNLERQECDYEKIVDFLQGLYDLLPVFSTTRGPENDQLLDTLCEYRDSSSVGPFISRSEVGGDLNSEGMFDMGYEDPFLCITSNMPYLFGPHTVTLASSYNHSSTFLSSKANARARSIEETISFEDLEGVVFQFTLPLRKGQVETLGWVSLDMLNTVHVITKKPEVIEMVQQAASLYEVAFQVHNHICQEDEFCFVNQLPYDLFYQWLSDSGMDIDNSHIVTNRDSYPPITLMNQAAWMFDIVGESMFFSPDWVKTEYGKRYMLGGKYGTRKVGDLITEAEAVDEGLKLMLGQDYVVGTNISIKGRRFVDLLDGRNHLEDAVNLSFNVYEVPVGKTPEQGSILYLVARLYPNVRGGISIEFSEDTCRRHGHRL